MVVRDGHKKSNATDIDECGRSGGHVCSTEATCENVPGSFRCHCNSGFRLAADGRICEGKSYCVQLSFHLIARYVELSSANSLDVDECETGQARCQQRCINIPG